MKNNKIYSIKVFSILPNVQFDYTKDISLKEIMQTFVE